MLVGRRGGRLVLWVYSALLLLVLVAGAPWWLFRMATSGRYRAGLAGRLGFVPEGLLEAVAALQGRELILVHAVSVGEVLAAAPMIQALEGEGYGIAVSTTTQAGQELARRRFAGLPIFYMPLDFAWLIRRYLDVLRPRLVVTMESELWPNLIHTCRLRGIPLTVVNARVSDRSFPRYMRLRRIWGPLLREVSLFLAQSEETAERLVGMGVSQDRVTVCGNLKYDIPMEGESSLTKRIGSLLFQARLVVAGSTLHDEERLLLEGWPAIRQAVPDAALLIAPRHTNRFDEVLKLIRESGYPFFRCTQLMLDTEPVFGGTILLLDTIGDLASMYSLAAVAFVGGSLMPKGGHNPLEAARFGVPVVMGESYENFRGIVEAMRAEDAIRIARRDELAEALIGLLEDSGGVGGRGRGVFVARAGATERTVRALVGLVRG